MTTFVLIHGGYHGGWCWQPVVEELARRGHRAIAPDLPCDDPEAGYDEYLAAVLDAMGPVVDPDVVVVGYLGHFDVRLARLLFRRGKTPIVLDHLAGASDTAKDRRLDGGPRQILLRMIDSGALRAADVIVVDTQEHLDALPPEHRDRAVVVAVGAPVAWNEAAAAAAPTDDGPLKVVFYGLYTPLQGAPVIGAALGKLAGAPVEVTMIGGGQDEAETKAAAAGRNASSRPSCRIQTVSPWARS